MIKIIVRGKKMDKEHIRRFTCGRCGCVFEADGNDYRTERDPFNDLYYSTCCPNCGDRIYEVS